jgi:hypothetical protein
VWVALKAEAAPCQAGASLHHYNSKCNISLETLQSRMSTNLLEQPHLNNMAFTTQHWRKGVHTTRYVYLALFTSILDHRRDVGQTGVDINTFLSFS